MASYTDALTKFNPYVEQLPVDAMVQVGMYKQAKYDEGVEKIQGYIDNIAGLDVTEKHKPYLQSKLNELGNNLKKVAGGDFSNFQLVNSVGGMATQIVKDPTIQNAVYSTKVIRKGQKAMEEAKKAGKSSVENEWWWGSQINDWMNDKDLKSKFNGEYVEYKDMDKKLRDVAEKVHEYDNSVDIPYLRTDDGKVLYFDKQGNASLDPTKGEKKIDDVMLRVITKGKSAEKILANFYSSIDENDKRQLMITGNYHYKDATRETFKNDITNAYSDEKKILNERVVNLATSLSTDPKLSSTQKAAITAQITAINKKLKDGSLDVEMQQKIATIDKVGDLKQYKYQLYTQKYLTGLANDLSYESMKTQFENNPYFQADMEKKKLQVQVDHYNQLQKNWRLDYNYKVSKDASDREWDKYKFQLEHPELFSDPYVVDSGTLSTDVESNTLDKLNDRIASRQNDINTLDSKFNGSEVPDWNNMTAANKKKYLDDQYGNYEKNPGAFLKSIHNNNLREYLTSRYEIEQAKVRDNNLYKKIFEESKDKFEGALDKKLASIGGITLQDEVIDQKSGTRKTVTRTMQPSEAIQFYNDFISVAADASPETVDALSRSLPYGSGNKALFMALYRYQHNEATANDKAIVDRVKTLQGTYNAEHYNMLANKKKWESQRLNELDPQRQTQLAGLQYNTNKKMKMAVDGFISNIMNLNSDKLDKDLVNDITAARSGTDVDYNIEKNYDGTAVMHIKSSKGTVNVPISANQLRSHFSDIAITSPFNQWKDYMNSSPGTTRTTNAMGLGTSAGATSAAIGGWTLPGLKNSGYENLVRIDIEGNNSNTGEKSDLYQLRMYVYDQKTGIWKTDIVTRNGFKDQAAIQQDLQGIGPATIKEFLNITK